MFTMICVDTAESETTIEYRVTQASTNGVCVECSFLDKSAEHCVVIIHEKVVCFGLSQCEINLTNIVISFKIARSGDKGYRCVQNITVTNYQVGVIGGRQVSLLVTNTGNKVFIPLLCRLNYQSLFFRFYNVVLYFYTSWFCG